MNRRTVRIKMTSGLAVIALAAGAGIATAASQASAAPRAPEVSRASVISRASAAVHYPQFGDKGGPVYCIQNGIAYSPLPVHFNKVTDGIFGINTKHDVEEFQAYHGLTVDGIVGPDTGTVILNFIGQNFPQPYYDLCSRIIPHWI
jgi:peptidoglycan hydrolase-like protein with peptidoglycan-binding domain